MRVLTDDDVRAALPSWDELLDLAEEALVALAEGRAEAPPKPAVHTAPGMFANAMPAAHPERNLLGCKWISVVPDNPVRGLPTATGVMIVNDGTTGEPTCLMPATELTAVRTAAVTCACVRTLAGDDPITYFGAGLSIGLTDTRLPVTLPRSDALMLPLDYASSIGPDLAETATLAADDMRQFEAVRADRAKLGAYPRATAWTGHLLGQSRPRGRVVIANLGSGASDLLVADAIAMRAQSAGLGTEVAL